jgi:hypothetical protein
LARFDRIIDQSEVLGPDATRRAYVRELTALQREFPALAESIGRVTVELTCARERIGPWSDEAECAEALTVLCATFFTPLQRHIMRALWAAEDVALNGRMIAERIQPPNRGLRRALRTLCGRKLITCDGDGYRLSREGALVWRKFFLPEEILLRLGITDLPKRPVKMELACDEISKVLERCFHKVGVSIADLRLRDLGELAKGIVDASRKAGVPIGQVRLTVASCDERGVIQNGPIDACPERKESPFTLHAHQVMLDMVRAILQSFPARIDKFHPKKVCTWPQLYGQPVYRHNWVSRMRDEAAEAARVVREGTAHTDNGPTPALGVVPTVGAHRATVGSGAYGPAPPDLFRWEGVQVCGFSPHQWRFLDALFEAGRLRDAVPVAEIIRHVYGADASTHENQRRALEQVRRRTQAKLDGDGVRLLIDLTNHTYRLIPTS